MAKKPDKETERKRTEDYIAFLRKRLGSANYKAAVTKEEFERTKRSYEKAKFRLKMMMK